MMATDASPALLHRWRELPGVVYGLRQKTAIVIFDIPSLGVEDVNELDVRISSITGLIAGPVASYREPPVLLLRSLLTWYFTIHSAYRVPVFPEYSVINKREAQGSRPLQYSLAMPHAPAVSEKVLRWILAVLSDTDSVSRDDLKVSYSELTLQMASQGFSGTNGIHFARAAFELEIEYRLLSRNIISAGTGRWNRWLQSSISDETSYIGVQLSGNKYATNRLLQSFGLPVPRQTRVHSPEHCEEMAAKFGYPVVIKPARQEQGKGVTSGIRSVGQLDNAYKEAVALDDVVLMEKHHDGVDVRFTVVRGKVCKVFSRTAGGITGDGRSTVRKLVLAEQGTERMQRLYRQYGRYLLDLDVEAYSLLEEEGLGVDSIPESGRYVRLRRKNNISAGGSQSLIPLSEIHKDNMELAIRASAVLRIDIAGVDLIIPDVRFSWRESGCVIIEVNARPEIGVSLAPETYRVALLRILRQHPHVPCHLLLLNEQDGFEVEALLDHARRVGANCLATRRGIWFHDQPQSGVFRTGFEASIAALMDRKADAVLCVLSATEILSFGFPGGRYNSIADYCALGRKRRPTPREMKALELSLDYLK